MRALVFTRLVLLLVVCVLTLALGVALFRYKSMMLQTRHDTEDAYPNRTRPLRSLPVSRSCSCHRKASILQNAVQKDELEGMKQRRHKEFKSDKLRKLSPLSTPLYALPNSPLQFPFQGFIVRPLTPTPIPNLRLEAKKRSSYKVSLKVTRGILTVKELSKDATITGDGEDELTIRSNQQEVLNHILSSVVYTSTIYHINTGDLASFRFEQYEAIFPIVIRQPKIPVLMDTGSDINSYLTITTKTFVRYDKVALLVDSIRKFYPNMRIVIADDSFEKEPIPGNVDHYYMPAEKGLFAGRGLVVSQVTTKYFVWVDDDFLFTEATKLEKFVEILEAHPELDVVGGTVSAQVWAHALVYDEGDEMEGGCMITAFNRNYKKLPDYPQCTIISGIINFFVARTDSIRKVGFDNKLMRVGHRELFIDGLGRLMFVSCRDRSTFEIGHQPRKGNSRVYSNHRFPPNINLYKFPLFFFKNHLKCLTL
ncbi:beta-1,4 N-acetylgalactosaminyltransferase 2-like [Gouania willdenowi]|uniref:Beta-1,4 N-acetylgalactosaminyltransferase 2-like n=1 Tax=Gouania willdenowi TaxID=441366 RepID=A0A8C5DU24_GOUWI|nr:beta-1,4 N-acetylgalactosaminyltransferase 2-like [Gouania willdenowi]XP_028321348.1 beta-1,4 N-acetylgalactosaminyltransferase 2-like [Gouania willdenowi]